MDGGTDAPGVLVAAFGRAGVVARGACDTVAETVRIGDEGTETTSGSFIAGASTFAGSIAGAGSTVRAWNFLTGAAGTTWRGTAPSSQRCTASTPTARTASPMRRRLDSVTAHAKGITLRGTAVLDWRHDGREYEAQLAVSSPLLRTRTQRSTGLVTSDGLAPQRFSDKARSEEAVHFDRENGKVVFSANKPEVALEPGAQDRLSIVLQLGAMFAAAPSRYPAGTAITLQTASARDAEPWTFVVEGPQTLVLPGGRVPTVYLTRAPRREYDVKVELWLAPGAAYGPVRLRLTQPNGDWVDQQWSSTDRG